MSEYNISTLIMIMVDGFADTQVNTGTIILDAVATHPNVNVNVDGRMISNLVKRKSEVHQDIRAGAGKKEIRKFAANYIKDNVLDRINPVRLDDVCSHIIDAMTADKNVSKRFRQKVQSQYDEGKYQEFFTDAILYALSVKNMPAEEPVEAEDFYFLQEADGNCPLCGKPLIKRSRNKAVINAYRRVQIYPEDISTELAIEFTKIQPPPQKYSSPDNNIVLCLDCSEAYLADPNLEDYQRLLTRKENISKSYTAKQRVAQLDMDLEIAEVVSAIAKLDMSTILTPFTDPYSVENKVNPEYYVLLTEIKDHVRRYYPYIESQFSQLDGIGGNTFNEIRSEMTLAYEMLENAGLDQPEIFNQLAEKIVADIGLGDKYKLAANIVVSFFVQLCSVFKVLDKEGTR